MPFPRVVIIGAGISGLSLAFRLRKRCPDTDITLLEQAGRSGGTVWTAREEGFQVEIGPNGFLDTKPTTLSLCRDLGLGSELVAASEAAGKNRYLYVDGKLKALPGSLPAFLGTSLLSWRGKLALLMERFRRQRRDAADESIDAFARRRAGKEAAELLADAMVTGIYAGDPKLLSLPACFPRLAEMERTHGSVLKGFAAGAKKRRDDARAAGLPQQRPGKMWSLKGGLRVLVERLTDSLHSGLRQGVNVRAIRAEGNPNKPTWRVQGDGHDSWLADAVVLTCPAHQQARILAELDVELASKIDSIAYNRIAVVALGYVATDVPMPLNGFGFIAPQATRRDVLGVQWCSSIFSDRAPNGCVLLRAMCGGAQRGEMVDWDDERLLASLRAELQRAMSITAAPLFYKIIRWPRAIPQYHVGHLERVRWIESRLARHPGLHLGGNAYHGVSLNDCTERSIVLADQVAAACASP